MKYKHKITGTILEPRTELAEAQLAKSEEYEPVTEKPPKGKRGEAQSEEV